MSKTKKQPSYTARELEEETGFDRRTIAYYVQERLLPRVGRRGPRTRYPRLVRDRLLFIRRVREAEEAGEVPAVSLSDMRRVFQRVPPALIAKVAEGEIAVTPELADKGSTRFTLPAMRRAMLEERVMASPPRERGVAYSPPPPPMDVLREQDVAEADEREEDLAGAMAELQERARRRDEDSPATPDTWTRIGITPQIELAVRGLTDEDRPLLERVRRALVRLLGGE